MWEWLTDWYMCVGRAGGPPFVVATIVEEPAQLQASEVHNSRPHKYTHTYSLVLPVSSALVLTAVVVVVRLL